MKNQVSFHYTYPVDHPIRNELPEETIKNGLPSDLMEILNDLESSNSENSCEMTPKQFADKLLRHTTSEKSYRSWRVSLEYPQNLLRNVAKSGCQTTYTMLPDIDMIPNKNMDLQLEKFLLTKQPSHCLAPTSSKSKVKTNKCAFVVPVYEISNQVEQLPKDKIELLGLLKNKLSRPFHSALFSINQKASQLKLWEALQSNSSSQYKESSSTLKTTTSAIPTDEVDVGYKVDKYQFKYEPLYVAKADTPIFDERFIGFGMTRNTQVCYIICYRHYWKIGYSRYWKKIVATPK